MIRKRRAAFPALCFMLAACATAPNSALVRTIEITPSAALDDDLKKLDDVVIRRDFLTVPTGRDRVETGGQPVDVLRTYEFRDRRPLRLTIGWELRRSRYRIFVTDLGRSPARGLECRKYLEIFADVTTAFGANRVAPAAAETCDPTAGSD
jgi:hypothetical protein